MHRILLQFVPRWQGLPTQKHQYQKDAERLKLHFLSVRRNSLLLEFAVFLWCSDQGWQYQHAEYQRLLAEHNITQSMSRKGNCMDNGAMENFFGRLKVEMFYGEKFESVNAFIDELKKYIDYYNNERISLKLKGMSPVQYRTHSQAI